MIGTVSMLFPGIHPGVALPALFADQLAVHGSRRACCFHAFPNRLLVALSTSKSLAVAIKVRCRLAALLTYYGCIHVALTKLPAGSGLSLPRRLARRTLAGAWFISRNFRTYRVRQRRRRGKCCEVEFELLRCVCEKYQPACFHQGGQSPASLAHRLPDVERPR